MRRHTHRHQQAPYCRIMQACYNYLKYYIYVIQHLLRARGLCESRGESPGLPVPNSPYGHRGRKVTLKKKKKTNNTQKAGLAQREDVGQVSGPQRFHSTLLLSFVFKSGIYGL